MSKQLSAKPKVYGKDKNHGSSQKARFWMITYNLPKGVTVDDITPADMVNIKRFNRAAQVSPVTYCIFQGEAGEEDGHYHLQAYAEFDHPVGVAQIKKHFGINQLHCEIRVGTQEDAIKYCSKEETRVSEVREYGTKYVLKKGNSSGQGARYDLSKAWTQLKEGVPIPTIIDEQPHLLSCVSALNKAQWEAMRIKNREWKTQLIVFSGDARTGKTSTAIKFAKTFGGYFLMPSDGHTMYWNGYEPLLHDTVILDEFTGSKCPLTFLNQLTDSYNLRLPTKGGYLPFLARRIIITSNFEPFRWYDFSNREKNLCWEALEGRIDTHMRFSIVNVDVGNDKNGIMQTVRKLHLDMIIGDFHPSHVSSKFPLENIPTPEYASPDVERRPKLKRKNAEEIVISSEEEELPLNQTQKVRRLELYADSSLEDSSSDAHSYEGDDIADILGSNPDDSSEIMG